MFWLIAAATIVVAILCVVVAFLGRGRQAGFNPDHDPTDGFDVTRFRNDHHGFWGGG